MSRMRWDQGSSAVRVYEKSKRDTDPKMWLLMAQGRSVSTEISVTLLLPFPLLESVLHLG